jgi:RNA polymerase sigma factor (sigma-70 family)
MDASAALVKVLREEGPRVLATLVRQLGDLAVAEDALSEATIAALGAWPGSGIPENPRAWLTVVARRKAVDLLRRESARTDKEAAAFRWGTEGPKDPMEEVIDAMETESELRDDMLRLIFTCCHPALSREAQVALALRTLARLEVDAIARAFLVPEATMAKRLVRARSKIATAHIPYVIPSDAELPDRRAAVLAVVYLIATEAHAPTGGTVVARVDLEAEAVRLARLLVELMPDEPEALSLLALLLFTSARTPARSDADGNTVTLADQDRGRWNREAIGEGSRWLSRAVALSGGAAGPYQLQAHLAAAHSTATSWSETDWDRIVGLYELLGSVGANPVVALNRAVAVTQRDGPEQGLAALEAIVGLERSHLWHAALADNLRRLGRLTEAAGELETAASLAPTEGERRLLISRLLDARSETPDKFQGR